ncbi:hypothetical protein FACS1894217_06420 [Clostridia bacterium]|nr:hypothetical protein FACS1894217_06420 [Clostridia bacterium]
MKIAFSTIGCPRKNWEQTCALAREEGFAGFEVRDLGSDALTYAKFLKNNSVSTRQELLRMGLRLTCFSIGKSVKTVGKQITSLKSQKAFREEARNYINTAASLGCPYVRLQIDDYTKYGDDDTALIETLDELVPYAEAKKVTLLVETKGIYSDTKRLRKLLTGFRSDVVGALWDIDHTFHQQNPETPEQTVDNLGTMIKYVHLRDSVSPKAGESRKDIYKRPGEAYRLMGEGDIPIKDAMLALSSISFDGFVSFEWLGHEDDSDMPIKDFMRHMVDNYSEYFEDEPLLFNNRAGTGKFFWKKEQLIDSTLPEVLDRVIAHFPDQYAFRYTMLNYTRTYRQFRDDVDRFARSLIALGVRKKDRVAIWAPNLPEWFITFWAAVKIGAVLVTVNTSYKIQEAEYLLRQSDTHTLVMSDNFKDSDYTAIIKEICPELATVEPGEQLFSERLPRLRNVIKIGSAQKGCYTWKNALKRADDVEADVLAEYASHVRTHDVCNMQYTSGTTGFPKGVMLTHYNVVNNGKNIGDRMDLSTADRFLIHVPMFHCFGMVLSMTASMTHGATMCPIPAFSPRLSLDCINRERITACNGVPTMFIAMLETMEKNPDYANTDFSHMRTGIMAGSPCPVKVMREVIDKMNMREITIVFGQTESSPGCTMSTADDSIEVKVNTVGSNLPGVECRIIDPVTYEPLPDNTPGEFVARGYNIMKGYYKMPAATAAAIDADGWLHTGDLALRLPDGNFKITGRIKDMIIRGGENIYPKEIEDFIYTHEKVKDVQIIGVPDSALGEEIMAWVILREGVQSTQDEIKQFVLDHMARHKVPKYVRFVEEFPMNAAGKILKYKMVAESIELLGLGEDAKVQTA